MKKGCFFEDVERPSREGLLTWRRKRRSAMMREATETRRAGISPDTLRQHGSSREAFCVGLRSEL